MSQADSFWFRMDDPTNLMMITGFWEFRSRLDFNRLLATLETNLAPFPRFRQKVVKPASGIGMPKWTADSNFDLRSHVHRIGLPDPGDKNDLQEMIGQLMTISLDHNKPLWDAYLIENYQNGCALFFRLHHCIADGIALMHVLHSMADTSPDAPWPKQEEPGKKIRPGKDLIFSFNTMVSSAKNAAEKGLQISSALAGQIKKISQNPSSIKLLAKIAGDLPADAGAVLSRHLLMKADPPTAFKGKLGVRKSVVWTDPIPLERIKSLGRAISSATLNDVLIASVAGAMRRYLITRSTRVNELDLRVTVPVNIRKPGREFELGNSFSLVFLSLPVFLKDPVLRLREVQRRMNKLKVSADPYVNFGLLRAIGYLPEKLAKRAATLFANKASGVLTNVPGPRQPLYFAGEKISNIMFWVPRSGAVGLGISILSYNNTVTIGVASDSRLMPDPETLLEGFEEEFNLLTDLVVSGKIDQEPLVLHDRSKEKLNAAGRPPGTASRISRRSGSCAATTGKGSPCRNKAIPDSDYCRIHSRPEEGRQEKLLEDVALIMKNLTG